jgi:hypothetical protein
MHLRHRGYFRHRSSRYHSQANVVSPIDLFINRVIQGFITFVGGTKCFEDIESLNIIVPPNFITIPPIPTRRADSKIIALWDIDNILLIFTDIAKHIVGTVLFTGTGAYRPRVFSVVGKFSLI